MFQGSHQIGCVKLKRINDTIRHRPNYCVMEHYCSNTWNYCVIIIMFHYLWLFSTWMQHECWMIRPFSFSRNRKGLIYFSYFSPKLEWIKNLRSQERKQSHSPTLQQVHTIDNNSACHFDCNLVSCWVSTWITYSPKIYAHEHNHYGQGSVKHFWNFLTARRGRFTLYLWIMLLVDLCKGLPQN